MSQLEIKDVSVTYRNRRKEVCALNHVSLSFFDEKINGILGPSGSGKTTLLKSIMGLLPYTGDILSNGKEFSNTPIKDRNIGYVSQDIVLYPHLDIFHNIAFPLMALNVDPDEIKERVLKIADEFSLNDLLFAKPNQISLGQAEKVAFAKVLVKRPEYLLLDEPFANLDKANQREMDQLLSDISNHYQTTILLVSHDENEILELSEKIFVLDSGSVVFSGNKKQFMAFQKSQSIQK